MRILKVFHQYLLNRAIKKGLRIGEDSRILGKPNFGSEPYLIRIGKHCTITSGVKFITHDGGTWVFRREEEYKHIKKYGKIDIKDNCFIGINTIIMPNVTIGSNCVIGAGSVVTKDIPDNSVAVGNPARVIMSLDEYIRSCEKKATVFPPNAKSKKDYLVSYFWGD